MQFQVFLLKMNNSIKHQPFVYILLNTETVLFQSIPFSISHLVAQSLNVKQLYQVLPLRGKVDLGVMAMKGYSAFPKAPVFVEPHHQIILCCIQDMHCGESADRQSEPTEPICAWISFVSISKNVLGIVWSA